MWGAVRISETLAYKDLNVNTLCYLITCGRWGQKSYNAGEPLDCGCKLLRLHKHRCARDIHPLHLKINLPFEDHGIVQTIIIIIISTV